MIYLTSDEHYGHRGIIKYCKRPFRDVEEMNECMVWRHNQMVDDSDEVYHLGDFAFSEPELWLARLKGRRHHLILGNHDYKRLAKIEKAGFWSIQDVLYLRYQGLRFYLSHYAHRTWRNSIHGSYHAYGHSHGNIAGFHRSMDVGVDAWDFTPIPVELLVDRLYGMDAVDQHRFEAGE